MEAIIHFPYLASFLILGNILRKKYQRRKNSHLGIPRKATITMMVKSNRTPMRELGGYKRRRIGTKRRMSIKEVRVGLIRLSQMLRRVWICLLREVFSTPVHPQIFPILMKWIFSTLISMALLKSQTSRNIPVLR